MYYSCMAVPLQYGVLLRKFSTLVASTKVVQLNGNIGICTSIRILPNLVNLANVHANTTAVVPLPAHKGSYHAIERTCIDSGGTKFSTY